MKTRSLSLLAVCVAASIFVLLARSARVRGKHPPHPPQPRGDPGTDIPPGSRIVPLTNS